MRTLTPRPSDAELLDLQLEPDPAKTPEGPAQTGAGLTGLTGVAPTALLIGAIASAGAGLVHAAASGSHSADRTLALVFSSTAVAQIGWAAAAILKPRRNVAAIGVALNVAFLTAWAISRTRGLPVIESLAAREEVGTQDLLGAVLGATAVAAAGLAVLLPRTRPQARRSPNLFVGFAAGLGALTLAVPGMAAQQSQRAGADHGHGREVAAGAGPSSAAPAMDHSNGNMDHSNGNMDHSNGNMDHSNMNHDHGSTGTTVGTASEAPAGRKRGAGGAGAGAGAAGGGHSHMTVPARLDHDPTEEQLVAAKKLAEDTKRDTAKYATTAAAEADGYIPIGDAMTGVEHWVRADYLDDDATLDTTKVESLVYKVLPDGGRQYVTAMYILKTGTSFDDIPDVAGNLTVWHDHQNLCWQPGTTKLAGIMINGKCMPSGEFHGTAPMLHVWVIPNRCGTFAGTDGGQMTGSCSDHNF